MFFKSKFGKGKESKSVAPTKHDGWDGDEAKPASASSVATASLGAKAPVAPTDAVKKARSSRGIVHAYGAIITVLSRSKRHRNRTLAEIEEAVVPAVLSGQYSLAEARHDNSGVVRPVAAVLWASVSEDVDRRLAMDEAARLRSSDWMSGKIVWIVEAVGDTRMLDAMVKRLRDKLWKGRLVKVRTRTSNGKVSTRIVQALAS
jgi:hemolysin-activating ACP:hemolysin acyltransferase